MKFKCRFHGCSLAFVHPSHLAAHERQPHVRCSCGRHFLQVGVNKHLAYVRRHKVAHPPIPDHLPVVAAGPATGPATGTATGPATGPATGTATGGAGAVGGGALGT